MTRPKVIRNSIRWGILAAGVFPATSFAATHTVTTLTDDVPGSLRNLVEDVAADGDTIVFDQALDAGTIVWTDWRIDAAVDVTIDASSLPNGITLSGDDQHDLFMVDQATIHFKALTFTKGFQDDPFERGGAINSNGGNVTITDCHFSDNESRTAGAIYVFAGNLTIVESSFTGNSTSGKGGAIVVNRGTHDINDCRFAGNTAVLGGAIANFDNATLTIEGCLFNGNSATDRGGAIYNDTDYDDGMIEEGSMTLRNCTLSGNSSINEGGGIFNWRGLVELQSCTITANTAPANEGGGVVTKPFFGETHTVVRNSIIAGNAGDDLGLGNEPEVEFTSEGHNLIGDGDGVAAFNATGDLTGVGDPQLQPLGDFGGPTQTHAVFPGSPAWKAGESLQANDQRGESRGSHGADEIGAFEFQAEFVYGSNFGWTYWSGDAGDYAQVNEFIGSGYLWTSNFGWINIGSGSPANGHQYQNLTQSDFGLNVTGFKCPAPGVHEAELRGLAWAANFGWINFEAMGDARIDLSTGELRGHAWAPNLGWLNLGEGSVNLNVAFDSLPGGVDSDSDGIADPWEMLHAMDLATMTAFTDSDDDGTLDVHEYQADTDPFDPSDDLAIVSISPTATPGEFDLTFTSKLSRLYQLRQNEGLGAGWADEGGLIKPAGPATSVTALEPGDPARHFWRVRPVRPMAP